MADKNSITVRHPHFSFDEVSKPGNGHYIAGNSLATHFMNAMHIIVPVGERFFIRSVKKFSDHVTDPELKKRVKAFIGQEHTHDKEHTAFWKVLEKQGLKPAVFESFFSGTAFGLLEPAMNFLFGDKFGLSATVALEHMTAFGTANALNPDSSMLGKMHPEVAELLRWHAVEEIEHKSVAFDVLKEVDDNYFLRIGGFIFAVTLFQLYGLAGMLLFTFQDPEVSLPKLLEDLQEFAELNRRRMSPAWFQEMFDYFRPDFHPDQNDNYGLIEPYLKKYEQAS